MLEELGYSYEETSNNSYDVSDQLYNCIGDWDDDETPVWDVEDVTNDIASTYWSSSEDVTNLWVDYTK